MSRDVLSHVPNPLLWRSELTRKVVTGVKYLSVQSEEREEEDTSRAVTAGWRERVWVKTITVTREYTQTSLGSMEKLLLCSDLC